MTDFAPTPHPCLPLLTTAEQLAVLRSPNGAAELAAWHLEREEVIRLAAADPLNFGFEPAYTFPDGVKVEPWRDADGLLGGEETQLPYILGIFGGNRAMKSYYAAKRLCQCVRAFRGIYVALAEQEITSVAQQQKLVWDYLRPHYGHLNGKRDPNRKWSINYSPANGFADRKLVLPNGSEVYFLLYNQDAKIYEGWEFGPEKAVYERVARELQASGRFVPPRVGAWADESLTLSFLGMFHRRLPFRKAALLWTFTAVDGITPAVKELVGKSARTLRSLPAEMLPRQNLPEIPKGHMPYVQQTTMSGSRAIYFFSIFNPFGGYYGEIKRLCAAKTSEYTERVAYGYARDSVHRAYQNFGPWNVVEYDQLPAVGTNYMVTDPAGARNWMTLWVRVTPGREPDLYIYRDWPDLRRHGEWAVATERKVTADTKKGWDGDPGPAQNPSVAGILPYKRLFLAEERIAVSERIQGLAALAPPGGELGEEEWLAVEGELDKVPDPQHRERIRRAIREGGELGELYERIRGRYIDPRAGRNETQAERGGTCLIDELGKQNKDAGGKVICEGMRFIPASGVDIAEGISKVNDLLDWDRSQPLVRLLNAPHLYVLSHCRQVIWMLENYTGRGGEDGGCKDPADLVRYMALARLRHVDEGMVKVLGGGSY